MVKWFESKRLQSKHRNIDRELENLMNTDFVKMIDQ